MLSKTEEKIFSPPGLYSPESKDLQPGTYRQHSTAQARVAQSRCSAVRGFASNLGTLVLDVLLFSSLLGSAQAGRDVT